MSFTQAPFHHYVMMAIGWPSMLLYILVIISIVKSRKYQPIFRSQFYTLILAQSVPCIVLFLYAELILRPRKCGFYKMFEVQANSTLAQILYFLQLFLRDIVVFSFVPLALNRLIALRFAEKYAGIWTNRVTIFCVFVYWAAASVIVPPTVFLPSTNISFVPNSLENGLDIMVDALTNNVSTTGTLVAFVATFVCCCILHGLTCAHLISLKMHAKYDVKNKFARSNELLLFFSSFIMFFSLILDATNNAIRIIASEYGYKGVLAVSFDMWYVTTETMCISPPLSLLIASPLMRRQLTYLFGRERPLIVATSTATRSRL